MTAKKIALFIDADNVSPKFGKQIIDELSGRGELFIRRIYGNWEKGSLRGWNDTILNFSFRAVQQPDFVTGKNATDMCLTIDAMDVLHEGKAEIFALVSNDSDFTPLVIRLREGGMNIIGLGNSNASNAFRAACNEFIDMDAPKIFQPTPAKKFPAEKKSPMQISLFGEEKIVTLSPENSPPKIQPAPAQPPAANSKVVSISDRELQSERDKKIQQIHNILRESAAAHGNGDGFSSINHARQDIKAKNLSFTVRDFGYAQLKDFIVAFEKLYETRSDENGQRFFYRCRTNEPIKISADSRIKRLHDALREAVEIYAADEGFADLCSVGSHVNRKNLGFGVKDLGFSKMQKFLDAFPDRYELRKDEHKVFLRCRAENPADDKISQVHDILHKAAVAHANETGFTDLCLAGNSIGKQKTGFGIRSLGYSSLSKFVSDFPEIYEVQKSGKLVRYRCKS